MQRSLLTLTARNTLIIRITCVYWLISKIICWKVWTIDRLFPVIPPFDFLVAPNFIHISLLIISLAALVLLFFLPENRLLMTVILVAEICSCLFDQNRWQPWEYQNIMILLVFVINRKNEKNILPVIAFIIASTYFYSGLSKFNPAFLRYVWYKLTLVQLLHLKYAVARGMWVYHAGYLMGVTELLASIGLFFQRTKKIAAIFLIAMHVLIILVFGPTGINYDTIIWPWNIAMMAYLYIFFIYDNKTFTINAKALKFSWNKLVFILFAIMPAFSFIDRWDFFLSSSLFSARPVEMYICIKKHSINEVLKPYYVQNQNFYICGNEYDEVNVRAWAFDEMKVPAYPEMRACKSIMHELQKRYPDLEAVYVAYPYIKGDKLRTELK